MKPGHELDALVAEQVMGWRKGSLSEPLLPPLDDLNPRRYQDRDGFIINPSYSTEIAAAWEVVNSNKFCCWSMKHIHETEVYIVQIEYDGNRYIERSDTAPHAICLAALKAVGHDPNSA